MPTRSRTPALSRAVLMARTLAAERGIFKIQGLHNELVSRGITISSSQLGKVLRNQTQYCDLVLLDALRKVLDVSFDQLLTSRELKRHEPRAAPKPHDAIAETTVETAHDTPQSQGTPRPPTLAALPKR